MTGRGHVFVVHGRLEHLDADALLVPTDRAFSVGRRWAPALGAPDDLADAGWRDVVRALRPDGWAERGWGRAADATPFAPDAPVWFVDSAHTLGRDRAGEAVAALTERLAAALADVASAALPAGGGRPRPVVAVPTLGVGRGGFDPVRGDVVDRVLVTCLDAVRDGGIDVAVVAAEASDHAAFQARRRALGGGHDAHLTPRLLDDARTLAERVDEGSLALFIGAGVSMSAGLPSWGRLIARLAEDAGVDLGALASPLDQSELLRQVLGEEGLGERVAELTRGRGRYGLSHALLASLGCREAVTTNYDDLYELAVHDAGHDVLPVLPFNPTVPRAPWLLKMHGDARFPETIVLSRSDFVGYDARSRPIAAVVQSLLMTTHLLVVGASMTDDNFLRIAHEVLLFRAGSTPLDGARGRDRPGGRALGTVVTFTADDATRRLWEGRFDYVAVADERTDGAGAHARRLAIFLDAVAMLATPPAYVADERYAALLTEPERDVAAAARTLRAQIADLPDGGAWASLAEALDALGAGRDAGLTGDAGPTPPPPG